MIEEYIERHERTENTESIGYVQQLVRCKDCKHGEKPLTFKYYPNLIWCNKYECSHDGDWFCADGERKEE